MDSREKYKLKERLVHLDLKGAPPKLTYLLKTIPLIRQWGATGLLVEYEDMFPFKDTLSCIRRKYAYNSEDLRVLQDVVKSEGMKFVPLIQSFGHLEYILKHKRFAHLRELQNNPMALCPSNKDSIPLIQEVIDQVMAEHEDLEYFHIGGDEVFCFAACKDCMQAANHISKPKLFIKHMVPLIQYIHSKWPKIKVMVWDDMFRTFSVADLEILGSDTVPVLWSYGDDVASVFPAGMFDRFFDVFDEIWVASSFKGSTGPVSDYVPIMHHINNHLSWLSIVQSFPQEQQTKVRGIAITGWTRFDHFSTLCEILPPSLPCLAICLAILKRETFTSELHSKVSKDLGYLQNIPLEHKIIQFDEACGNFPGSEILAYVGHLVNAKNQLTLAQERMEGWMDPWHIEVKEEFNECHVDFACSVVSSAIQIYEGVKGPLQECLAFHFDEETVQEFICAKIDANIKKALDMLSKLRSYKTFSDMKRSAESRS